MFLRGIKNFVRNEQAKNEPLVDCIYFDTKGIIIAEWIPKGLIHIIYKSWQQSEMNKKRPEL